MEHYNKFVQNLLTNIQEQASKRAVSAMCDIVRYLFAEGDYDKADGLLNSTMQAAMRAVVDGVGDAEFAQHALSGMSYARAPIN